MKMLRCHSQYELGGFPGQLPIGINEPRPELLLELRCNLRQQFWPAKNMGLALLLRASLSGFWFVPLRVLVRVLQARCRESKEAIVVKRVIGEVNTSGPAGRAGMRAVNCRPVQGKQRMQRAAHKRVAVGAIPRPERDGVHEAHAVPKSPQGWIELIIR